MSAALVESVRGLRGIIACREAPDTNMNREHVYEQQTDGHHGIITVSGLRLVLDELESLRVQLAASQAREVALREALAHYDGRAYHSEYESDGQIQWVAESALRSIAEPDTAALRKMLRHVATVAGREGMETTEALDELVDRVLGGS